jgi:hypothetical protein
MSGYLFFKSSGFLCKSLTEQHPFTRLPHMIRLGLFVQAHRGISPVDSWIQPSRSAGHDFEGITNSLCFGEGQRAALYFWPSERSSVQPKATETDAIQSCSGTIQ